MIGQRAGGRDRRFLARGDDGAGDGARMTLFAEDIDDVGEIGLGGLGDHVRRGRAVMAHPHVERTAEAKREAALGLVELHRGNPDVHHDAVDRRNPLRGANLGEIGKPVLDQRQPAARPIDQIEPARDRRAVAVDADRPGFPPHRGSRGCSRRPRTWHRHRCRRRGARASRSPGGRGREYDACQPDSCAGSGARSGQNCGNWTRTGPLRLKSLGSAVAFRPEEPRRRRIADPVWPESHPLISRWNMKGCHGISSVKWGLGRPPKPVRLFTT